MRAALTAILTLGVFVPLSWSQEAWRSKPAFQASVDELRKPLAKEELKDEVTVLYDETRLKFASSGAVEKVQRRIYRLESPAELAEEWAVVSASWSPWFESKPTVRARTISPSGRETWLDSKTIAEEPVATFDNTIFSDGRVIRAPLPAIEKGSLIEYEIVTRGTAPFFEAGVVHEIPVGVIERTLNSRVVVEAPPKLPVKWVARMLPDLVTKQTETKGSKTLIFEQGRLSKREFEGYRPREDRTTPYIAITTGGHWKDVATSYSAIVDRQIASAKIEPILRNLSLEGSRDAKVARILAAVHEMARYTGIEFGKSAIVPRTPTEVITTKYGDCKDKATLLVACLRAIKIPAYVALLSTDWEDPETELPGLGRFNHAIAYIPGERPLWIDATDPHSRLGQLPLASQGRLALIASSSTEALVRTSETVDNQTIVSRVFRFVEDSGASAEETVEGVGISETNFRSNFFNSRSKELDKTIREQLKNGLGLKEVTSINIPEPGDFSRPFKVHSTGLNSSVAPTNLTASQLGISPLTVFEDLPWLFKSTIDADTNDKEKKERNAEYFLPYPFVNEYKYRLEPVEGYEPRQLPEDKDLPMGPGRYKQTVKKLEKGIVEATFRFELPRQRFSAAEGKALRDAYAELVKGEAVIVFHFANVFEEQLANGQIKEPILALTDLTKRHSKDSGAFVRSSRALLAASAGESARAAARRAVELAPESAAAHSNLSWVLQHDLIGRRFGHGANLAEAVNVQRKAVALMPDSLVYKTDLAILLEHMPNGLRYTQGPNLNEAIQMYLAIQDKLAKTPLAENLPLALMYANRFREMKTELRKLGRSHSTLDLIATAKLDSVAAAVSEATLNYPDSRQRAAVLVTAAHTCIRLRSYAAASQFFASAAKASPDAVAPGQISIFENLKRADEIEKNNKPESTFRQALIRSLQPNAEKSLLELFSRPARDEFPKAVTDFANSSRSGKSRLQGIGIPEEIITDMAASASTCESSGDDNVGWRIFCSSGAYGGVSTAYIVKEDNEYRIAALATLPVMLAAAARRKMEVGDLDGAKRWLDWALNDIKPTEFSELAGPAFRYLWSVVKPSEEDIRVGIAALYGYASTERTDEILTTLNTARKNTALKTVRDQLDLAICETYWQRKMWKELLPAASALERSVPRSESAFRFTILALSGLKKFAEAEEKLKKRLKDNPESLPTLNLLGSISSDRGDSKSAEEWYEKAVKVSAGIPEKNNYVWYRIVNGTLDEKSLSLLSDAPQAESAVLHTLALGYAEFGKLSESRITLLRAIAVAGQVDPRPTDYLVLGRIFESCGLQSEARSAYLKVRDLNENDYAGSAWRIAEKRLKLISDAIAK